MVQRYFVDKEQWSEQYVSVTGEDVHHISRVMRMAPGDEIICIKKDDQLAASCEITAIENRQVLCRIVERLEENRELPVDVTIVQSIGKGDKLEQVIQKGTELGAHSFIPFQAERSISKWDESKARKKVNRLEKIAKEASEQSQRSHIPEVSLPVDLNHLLDTAEEFDVKVFAYEDEARAEDFHSLADHFAHVKEGMRILVVIGPEGGFSDREVSQLSAAHFETVRLGRRILRMETAPLYYLSSVSYHFEELR
ncbi:16S rRNA (uracil(1498)-N(3))-methyltransferase [Halobacillus salinarum]|uniref:Ribosomal RNA small subunit methyltransferase E n=1 Tax=Halobacillus salinarum TaxID=2932257 RepID=A0ABY4EQ60_9BACI|nr:16S rRNA (uracil(1498)-N(3))-methyltransferase [Halobacillus salinarum]UOQ46339.1 16S rRNA (uracil(1498)-N(3))-methyltransferase [Halobacillus salinarum]